MTKIGHILLQDLRIANCEWSEIKDLGVGTILASYKSYRDAISLRTQGHKVEFSVPHQKKKE